MYSTFIRRRSSSCNLVGDAARMMCWSNLTQFPELSHFDCRICVQFPNPPISPLYSHALIDSFRSSILWALKPIDFCEFVYDNIGDRYCERIAHLWLYCAITLNWKSFTWLFFALMVSLELRIILLVSITFSESRRQSATLFVSISFDPSPSSVCHRTYIHLHWLQCLVKVFV